MRILRLCGVFVGVILNILVVGGSYKVHAHDESGPGNGTDSVRVLFAEARQFLVQNLAEMRSSELLSMQLDQDVTDWLLKVGPNGSANFDLIRGYISVMVLRFGDNPCSEIPGVLGPSICFVYDGNQNVVLIDLERNRNASSDAAMAMLIHESGHFSGEMNHDFLDRVGVQLVAQFSRKVITAYRQSNELVANVFLAKQSCEDGTSAQAVALKSLALQDLQIRCDKRNVPCDFSKTQFAYSGNIEWIEGRGFTMKVLCSLRALLPLE